MIWLGSTLDGDDSVARLGDGGGGGPARMGAASGERGGARRVLLLGERWAGVSVRGSRVAADAGRGGIPGFCSSAPPRYKYEISLTCKRPRGMTKALPEGLVHCVFPVKVSTSSTRTLYLNENTHYSNNSYSPV